MAGANRDDVWKLFTYVQDDLRQTQAKLVELRAMLAAGAFDRQAGHTHRCPECQTEIEGDQALVEHRYTRHDVGRLCLDCGRAYDGEHICPSDLERKDRRAT